MFEPVEKDNIKIWWKYINNNYYYYDRTGAMGTGWQLIDKKWYYFDLSGVMKYFMCYTQ